MHENKRLFEKVITLLRTSTEDIVKILNKTKTVKSSDGQNWWYMAPKNKELPEICLVAHIDTVSDGKTTKGNLPTIVYRGDRNTIGRKMDKDTKPEPKKTVSKDGFVYYQYSYSFECLGADDRAGVASILDLYRKFDNVAVLFCNFEESGGIGAGKFCKDYKSFGLEHEFDKLKLFVEMDRHGTKHYVDYVGNPDEVKKWVDSFGWAEDWGTYSDISTISDNLLIPSINVATGYYHEHTPNETLVISEMIDANNFVTRLIEDINNCPLSKVTKKKFSYSQDWYNDYYNANQKKFEPLYAIGELVRIIYSQDDQPYTYIDGKKTDLTMFDEKSFIGKEYSVLVASPTYYLLRECMIGKRYVFWPVSSIEKVERAKSNEFKKGDVVTLAEDMENFDDFPRVFKISDDGAIFTDADYADFDEWLNYCGKTARIDGVHEIEGSKFYTISGFKAKSGESIYFPSCLINKERKRN